MECSENKRCVTVETHDRKLFDEDHGVFERLRKIDLCLRDIKLKKVGWKSLVICLAFIIGTFGYGWYRTTANAEDIPELKIKVEKVSDKAVVNEKEVAEVKKDISYNTTRIDKLITLVENRQKKQDEMFKEILKRLPEKDNDE